MYNKTFTPEQAPRSSLGDVTANETSPFFASTTLHNLASRGYRIHTGAAIIPTQAAGSEHAPPGLPGGRSEGLGDLGEVTQEGCLEEVENS